MVNMCALIKDLPVSSSLISWKWDVEDSVLTLQASSGKYFELS